MRVLASYQPTLDYVRRRTAEGKTKPEIIRCLKRFVAREIFRLSLPPDRPNIQRQRALDRYRSITTDGLAPPAMSEVCYREMAIIVAVPMTFGQPAAPADGQG